MLDFTLLETLDLRNEGSSELGHTVVVSEVVSAEEHDTLFKTVIEKDGRYFQVFFSWNHAWDMYTFFEDAEGPLASKEVFPREVTTVVYE